MSKKARVSWRLLTSLLLFTALFASAMWLVTTMPAQASQAAQTEIGPTAVTDTDWCATGGFNGWDNGSQPIYDDGTHGDLASGDGIYSLAYTFPTTGTQEWKVVECGTWNGHPSTGNAWAHTTAPNQEVTFLFDSNDHSADAGTVMSPTQHIVHSWGDDLPTSFTAVGDFNGWDNSDAGTLMAEEGNGIYKLDLVIATAGSYIGKVVETGTWNAYGANGRSNDAGNLSFTTASDNETVVFLLDTNTSRVTVTQHGTNSSNHCLAGDFNGWNNGSDPLVDDGTSGDLLGGDGIYSLEYEIGTAARNTWKIFDCGTWDSTMPQNAWSFTTVTSQTVKFTYDTNDHSSDAGWPFYPTQNIPNAWDDMPATFTAVGDWQSWVPTDTNTIMTNLGNNSYVYTQTFATAGTYIGKATNDGWNNQMSVDGRSVNGGNISFEVHEDGDIVTFWIDGNTGRMAIVTPPPLLPPIDMALIQPAVQHAVQDEVFYFALTDRFQDGDASNNQGGIAGTPVDHGYDPTDISYYHGGDLAGLVHTDTLDYLEGLGISAIWITPVFENNPTQPDSGATNSTGAAYHGYWILSYEDIDPHLGTNTELQDFISAAHARGMKVYFDFVANHTADVISYVEATSSYRSKTDYPYRDESGTEFDDRSYVYSDTFPVLSTTVSFPYTPQVAAGDENLKSPAWLNDPIYYHNRGDSTFAGESSEYGDFFGLDDIFTEHPDVRDGFTNIMTNTIATYGIDGFRIDTVKHVNVEFWEQTIPVVMDYATNNGKPDFFIFGEVFDGNVSTLSHYTTKGNMPSVLDFGLHGASINFAVNSNATDNLRDFYYSDDYYTDADSNANQLGVFVSNHDGAIERLGGRLRALSGTTENELIDRMELAYSLLYFGRGFPVMYYGDEQGFVGTGSDKLAREDMFPSLVTEFNAFDLIGTSDTTANDNFNEAHPLYTAFSSFATVYENNLALRRGVQIHRYSTNSAGVYAFSRIERDEKVEYIVALNNSESPQTVTFEVFEPNIGFTGLYSETAISSDANRMVTVTVPALDFVLYQADAALSAPAATPDITFNTPTDGAEVTGRVEVGVDLSEDIFAEVNFAVSVDGGAYEYLGTDGNAPYRIFYDVSGYAPGTVLTFQAIVNDLNGGYNNNIVEVVVGEDIAPGEEPYAIIHYYRPAGDYGDYTSDDFNDFWGLHLWGNGLADGEGTTWSAPKKFAGFDDFGAFVAIRLTDATEQLNFIIHQGDDKDTPNDRSFDPSVTPEIWLVQGDETNYASRAEATGTTLVHYNRPSADYTDWNLYLWQDDWDNDWNTSHPYDGMDDFGAVYTITTATYPSLTVTSPLNYIMHNGSTPDPDPGADRAYTPSEQYEIWLHSGVLTPSLSLEEANNTAVFHYARCLDDYGNYTSSDYNDFWGMHLWGDVDTPGVTWTTPYTATGEDDFGVIFEVPLAVDPTTVNYIFHRGDAKDTPADQSLSLSNTGYEIWVVNGDVVDSEGIRRQITSEAIAYSIKEQVCSGTTIGDIDQQQAYWLSENTIGWDPLQAADEVFLHTASTGGLVISNTGITGGMVYTLTRNGDITGTIAAKFPHLAGLAAWELDAGDLAMVPDMLKGQIAVSAFAGGELIDATGLQIPGVLDDLYSANAYSETLGVVWANDIPTLKLWAPTAKSVTLHLFDDAYPATSSVTQTMILDSDSGIWSVEGVADWDSKYYLYEVEVYVHSTQAVEHNMVTDPYSFSLAMNSTRSQIVDLDDAALMPAGWDTLVKPELVNPEDITIYEVHMRDFSVEDPLVPAEAQGTFKAFTYPNSNGMQHLQDLADAGLSHLHLLPVFDIATIDEDKSNWEEPDFTGADMSPDSEDQQAAVTAVENTDAFNWGYDPFHYTVPEGSYSTVPTGTQRIVEFREMVQAINGTDLRVVMDVVYNHTNASGQNSNSVLDKVVPGYYHRLNDSGQVETSTCCENTATEHDMMEKLMVDSLVVWARDYKVDAFRFDLMGHHMKDNMLAVRAALDALTLVDDGVDGSAIYLYGEGWNFGEVANNARGINATQLNMAGTGIGTFSDRLRDAVRGGGPFDSGEDLKKQGFANGLFYDPNLHPQPSAEADLLLLSDQIRVGLAGNLAAYEFIDRNGNLVTGDEVDYNGQPAGYTADPQEHIVYISKHDNQTLYDINAYAIPTATTTMTDRVRVQQVGLSIVSLSQGVPFYQAGSDMLRSKSMDRDSYNSGDWFNKLDFTYANNNWGVGLPVAGKNQENWAVMQPFLADPALMPTQADIEHSTAMYQEWLAIRASSPLFRLETAQDVQDRVSFENTGPAQIRGLIAMNLADVGVGIDDIDPNYSWIVVLFNANDEPQTISSATWVDQAFVLHPIQAASVDDVVKTTTFDSATGEFVIPGRTTAVFVLESEVVPTVTILTPEDGAIITATNGITASVPVVITTTDFVIPDDGHWHLWLDGVDMGPVMGYTTTVDLTVGTHVITAQLNTPDHNPIGLADSVTVTVTMPIEYEIFLPIVMKQ